MGIIAFFYALDSLYSDRRDRSVLFWKSLPLSDVETRAVEVRGRGGPDPAGRASRASIVAQFVIAAGGSLQLAMAGMPAGFMWQPEAIFGGISIAFLWCVTAILWYAPIIGYLMLASAWAPRGPFLWAVLPPVGLWVLERVVMGSEYVGDFITDRLFGLYRLLGDRGDDAIAAGQGLHDEVVELEQRGPAREPARVLLCAGAVARPGGRGAAAGGRDLGAPLPRRDELNPETGRSLTMKTIFRATAALALLAATLPALAASATATRSWQYKPESNAGLTVRNLMGNVRVERGTAPGFHVTANTTIETASQAEADTAHQAGRLPHLATSAPARASTCACRASTSRSSTGTRAPRPGFR